MKLIFTKESKTCTRWITSKTNKRKKTEIKRKKINYYKKIKIGENLNENDDILTKIYPSEYIKSRDKLPHIIFQFRGCVAD